MPVSFTADKQSLTSTGFSIEFDKIKDLPQGESIDFFVSFDPKAGNVSLGPVETVLPIKVCKFYQFVSNKFTFTDILF